MKVSNSDQYLLGVNNMVPNIKFSGACLSIDNTHSLIVDAESQVSTAFPPPIATRLVAVGSAVDRYQGALSSISDMEDADVW